MWDCSFSGVRYYYLRCSVLLVRCQVSVVCLSCRKFCGQKEPTHASSEAPPRPQGGQVSASGVARTVDGRSPSTVTPSKWTGFGRRCASCSGLRFPGAFGVDSQGVAVRRKVSTIRNEARLVQVKAARLRLIRRGLSNVRVGRLDRASSPRTSADRCMRFVRCSGCSSCSPGVAF